MRLCSRCRVQPCTQNHNYCYACARIARGQPPIAKIPPGRNQQNDVLESARSILAFRIIAIDQTCKNTSTLIGIKGGGLGIPISWARSEPWPGSLVFNRVHRGKMERKPCEVCGNPKVEAHHHKGYDGQNAYDVRWLCLQHHRNPRRNFLTRSCSGVEVRGTVRVWAHWRRGSP